MGAPATRVDEQEYLRLSAASETKLEYVGGYVLAMAGASPRHNLIAINVAAALGRVLATRPYLVFGTDQRVRVDETGAYVYPDASVVCDTPRFTNDAPASLLNPGLVIEVLSPSTEEYDRGVKLAHYRRLASVREVALVAVNERRVELYRRLESGQWLITDVVEGALVLESIGAQLDLAEVYAKVELLAPDPAPTAAAP